MVDSLQKLQEEQGAAIRRHDEENQVQRPQGKTIWVAATDPGIPVKLLDGSVVREEAVEVSAHDVFIARRIRDGSLRVTTAVVAKAEPPAQPQAKPLEMAADAQVHNKAKDTRSS